MAPQTATVQDLHLPASNENGTEAVNWAERLVWAELPTIQGVQGLYWPALLYKDCTEFDRSILGEAKATASFNYRIKLGLLMMEQQQLNVGQSTSTTHEATPSTLRIVRFLGRPLEDFHQVPDETYLDFISHLPLITQEWACKPHKFAAAASYSLYQDFHIGLDLSVNIMKKNMPSRQNLHSWLELAQQKWDNYQAQQAPTSLKQKKQQRKQPHQLIPRIPEQQSRNVPPAPVASPNHSVAAVSLTEDSLASTHATSTKPPSLVDNSVSTRESPAPSVSFPPLQGQPFRSIPWNQARVRLDAMGWSSYLSDDDTAHALLYQPFAGGPEYTEQETQRIAERHYGWEGQPASLVPPRNRTRSTAQPSGNQRKRAKSKSSHNRSSPKKKASSKARDYSFEFMWLAKLKPDGWTYAVPPRRIADLADYIYMKPGITKKHLGVLGEDYFESKEAVLEYCHREKYYPTTTDDSSVGSESPGEDLMDSCPSPSQLLRSHSTQRNEEGKRARIHGRSDSRRYWDFGVAWSVHLERKGWTMVDAKDNKYGDYYFVKPNKSVKNGVLNVDYYAREEDVLEEFRRSYYFTNASSADEESTKVPLDTEDEQTTFTREDYSTTDISASHTKKSHAPKKPGMANGKKNPIARQKKKNKDASIKNSETSLDADPSTNKAPWNTDPVLKGSLHDLCCTVAGISLKGVYYVLHKDADQSSLRFSDLEEFRKYYCRLGKDNYYIDPEAESSDVDKFHRWIRFAFVPGVDYSHRRIRVLRQQEVADTLQNEYNYECQASGEWVPPRDLRSASYSQMSPGLLKPSYASLPELLRDLYRVENLNGLCTSRRRKELTKSDNKEQLHMALRLYIADFENIEKIEESVIRPNQKLAKKSSKQSTSSVKRSSKAARAANATKSKEYIEVKIDPDSNRAPWVLKPLARDVWPAAKELGVSYNGGYYYLPDESPKEYKKRFTSLDDVLVYYGTFGCPSLELLDAHSRLDIKRKLAYTYVPGTFHDWRRIRQLKRVEAIRLLAVLDFKEKNDVWSVPNGLLAWNDMCTDGQAPLLKETYPSLSELAVALKSIPDIADKSGGKSRHRDPILTRYLTMALRLWIAEECLAYEGVNSDTSGSDDESSSDATEPKSQQNEMDEVVRHTPTGREHEMSIKHNIAMQDSSVHEGQDAMDCDTNESEEQLENLKQEKTRELLDSICSKERACELLKKLGCWNEEQQFVAPVSGCAFESMQELVRYILDRSILQVVPKENFTLTQEELRQLHRYLCFSNASLDESSPVYDALKVIQDGEAVNKLLSKVGFEPKTTDGVVLYTMPSVSTPIDLDEVVNRIRQSRDLSTLVSQLTTSTRSHLSQVEELGLRIWAGENQTELVLFDIEDLCIENHEDGMEEDVNPEDSSCAMKNGEVERVDLRTKDAEHQPKSTGSKVLEWEQPLQMPTKSTSTSVLPEDQIEEDTAMVDNPQPKKNEQESNESSTNGSAVGKTSPSAEEMLEENGVGKGNPKILDIERGHEGFSNGTAKPYHEIQGEIDSEEKASDDCVAPGAIGNVDVSEGGIGVMNVDVPDIAMNLEAIERSHAQEVSADPVEQKGSKRIRLDSVVEANVDTSNHSTFGNKDEGMPKLLTQPGENDFDADSLNSMDGDDEFLTQLPNDAESPGRNFANSIN